MTFSFVLFSHGDGQALVVQTRPNAAASNVLNVLPWLLIDSPRVFLDGC